MVMDIFWENGLSESDFSFLRAITLGKLSSISTIAKCGSNRIRGTESLLRDWQALSSGPSCDLHIPCGASPRSLWESSEITPAKLLARIETGRARIQTQIFLRPELLFRNSQGAQKVAPWLSFCFLVHSSDRLSPCCCVPPWVQGHWSSSVTVARIGSCSYVWFCQWTSLWSFSFSFQSLLVSVQTHRKPRLLASGRWHWVEYGNKHQLGEGRGFRIPSNGWAGCACLFFQLHKLYFQVC